MALKTRGKLFAVGLATFGAAAALAFGTGVAAGSDQDRPVLRITQDQGSGYQQTQQTQEAPQAPDGDARDCPFGHGSSNSGSSSGGSSSGGGSASQGDL